MSAQTAQLLWIGGSGVDAAGRAVAPRNGEDVTASGLADEFLARALRAGWGCLRQTAALLRQVFQAALFRVFRVFRGSRIFEADRGAPGAPGNVNITDRLAATVTPAG